MKKLWRKINNAVAWLITALGWVVMLISWVAAPYVTFVMFFAGGLVQAAQGIIDWNLVTIVEGLCKFVLCGVPGLVIAIVGSLVGCSLLI